MTADRSPGEWNLAVRQQAAVAHLGQLGLRVRDLDELLSEAMVAVADTLGVHDSVLFEVRAGTGDLQGRAGMVAGERVGRHALRKIRLGIDDRSLPGYAMARHRAVASPDLERDDRFHARAREFSFPGRSAIAAPIGWEQRPIGVLAAYDRQVRSWTDDEVRFVRAVATTIGLSMQRAYLEQDLLESRSRLATSLSAGGFGAWSWEVDVDRVLLSPTAFAMFGIDEQRWGGQMESFLARVHPSDRGRLSGEVDIAEDEGGERHTTFRILREGDGELRWIESWGRPLHADAGLVRVGVFADVTDRVLDDRQREDLLAREHAARVDAEAARERLAFLADASSTLSSSLDPEVIVLRVAEMVVPALADTCFVDLIDEGGALVERAALGASPEAFAAAQELRQMRRALGSGAPTQTGHLDALEGRPVLYPEITDEQLRTAAVDDRHYQLFLRADARSTVLAPLVSRGRAIGVVTYIRTGGRPPFTPDDVTLIEDVSGRAALAIDNGRLYASRARVARSLQAALLPPALPATPGLSIAARYDVAESDVAIGGDFYDVIELGGQAWGIVVGDVCGRGPDAAALTGLVRHTIRTAVVHETQPATVLANTNAAMLDQIDESRFCTAAFLRAEVIDAAAGRVRVAVAGAGHPRPILVRSSGEAEPLECSGTLLGVVAQPRLVEVEVELEAGDAVVLYTDGVTEARRGDDLFGERRLVGVVRDLASHPAEVIATGVEAAITAFRRSARDDTAILVLQASPSP